MRGCVEGSCSPASPQVSGGTGSSQEVHRYHPASFLHRSPGWSQQLENSEDIIFSQVLPWLQVSSFHSCILHLKNGEENVHHRCFPNAFRLWEASFQGNGRGVELQACLGGLATAEATAPRGGHAAVVPPAGEQEAGPTGGTPWCSESLLCISPC